MWNIRLAVLKDSQPDILKKEKLRILKTSS